MKITKRQLRRIIKEEKAKVLAEQFSHSDREVADRAIGLYFDVNQQKMTFDSLSVLFDEAVEDAMLDGVEDYEAVAMVSKGLTQLFNDWLDNRGR